MFSLFILFLQYFKCFTPLKHVKTNNMAFINYICKYLFKSSFMHIIGI